MSTGLAEVKALAVELAEHRARERFERRRAVRASRRQSARVLAEALDAAFPTFAAAWARCGRGGRRRVLERADELLPAELRIGGRLRSDESQALELRVAAFLALALVFPERVLAAAAAAHGQGEAA